jgi:hypothetical protein
MFTFSSEFGEALQRDLLNLEFLQKNRIIESEGCENEEQCK